MSEINPIRILRDRFYMTQRSLAEQAGMSPSAILRYEQGLYQEISEKICGVFKEKDSLDAYINDLPAYYRAWRTNYQYKASKYTHPLPNLQVRPNEHPFITWRKTLTTRAVGKDSRISFCILLAVHPSVVLDYENAKQAHMPKLIRDALLNAEVPATHLDNLDQLGVIYYDRRNRTV